jgi:hypothetical protein
MTTACYSSRVCEYDLFLYKLVFDNFGKIIEWLLCLLFHACKLSITNSDYHLIIYLFVILCLATITILFCVTNSLPMLL